ncbi:hypothetical protein IGI04_036183 [Brassica rapa subsp. trilocularis]|uniref:Uncharacterized protein n=1 Tax=Brassica rapa subsp. trilocularis TaxID=1813537 RepID=A0ABQ7LDW6_BRACM|nr:hypothetical protein IGI04_036183 [Brassica rapa subsp. trilocularis]
MECSRDGQSRAMPADSWRSDLPVVLPIRTKRLDIFPRDIQKQVSEAKKMGTLPDLSAIIAAQLGLTSGEGPSMTVPRAGEASPFDARSAGKGKKRKRGDGSGVERSIEETSDVPPSGEPQKKKKKRKTKKKSAGEQSENADEPIEQEEEDAREEELQPEEGASEAEVSGGRNDEEGVNEEEELETSLNAARSGGSEEDSEWSPLLIRMGNDEDDDERRSPVLTSPRERTPVPIGGGAVQTGTSSRGAAVLRRDLDLIFGSEYEEAARAKLLGDSTMNVVIDKYDTALKAALDELELAKKEFAEREEVSARQLNESRANLQKLNGMMIRTVARRDEFKAALDSSRREGVPGRGARFDGNNVPVLVLSDTSVEGRDSPPPEVPSGRRGKHWRGVGGCCGASLSDCPRIERQGFGAFRP